MSLPSIDPTWTLFLDRDGVINELLPGDYVKRKEEFNFLPGVTEALLKARKMFGRIIVVTNQRGISKGLMSHEDLKKVHKHMEASLGQTIFDLVLYCPFEDGHPSDCRKPGIGMPKTAQEKFPEIDFTKSIVVGDSPSDIAMGNRLGMTSVQVRSGHQVFTDEADFQYPDLPTFINELDHA